MKLQEKPKNFSFKNNISKDVLNNYLSRAVTHCGLVGGAEGENTTFEDDIRMLISERAKFIGRAVYVWGVADDIEHYKMCKEKAAKVHEADPEIVLQCCVFECVYKSHCNNTVIPEWVFDAFGLPRENRCFSFDAMLFPDGRFTNQWGKDTCVPNIMTIEGRMWIYYRSCEYINCGIEAIHFGQVWLIGSLDRENNEFHSQWEVWDNLVKMIRDYAKIYARRGYVICDAHCHGMITSDGRSILDFNSFPIRLKEIENEPMKCICEVGYSDSIFGKSKGGIHPSGWECDLLPFLVEFDNFGVSKTPGKATPDQIYAWGYDEITWFSLQPKEYRTEFLRYINNWVKERYPDGWVQMPSRRCTSGGRCIIPVNPEYFNEELLLSSKYAKDERIKIEDNSPNNPIISRLFYSANNQSSDCIFGLGDENTVKEIFN